MPEAAGLFFLGLAYSATLCTVTCLPYLGPYLLSTGKGFADGVRASLFFLAGKLAAYTMMGGAAAYLGGMFLAENAELAKYAAGSALILLGASIPFAGNGEKCGKSGRGGGRASLSLLGFTTSLIPCPPVMALLGLAAAKGSMTQGAVYGGIYGLGVAFSPLILIGGGFSMISAKLGLEVKGFVPYLRGVAAIIVIAMGINIIGAKTV